MKHRRVRRVVIDAVAAADRDYLDRRLVHARVTNLHRTRMCAQYHRPAIFVVRIDVERVLHRARRMIFGAVKRREVIPIGFYLRTFGEIESDRAKDLFDTHPRAGDWMNRADAAASTR